jgi:hypothetical protein
MIYVNLCVRTRALLWEFAGELWRWHSANSITFVPLALPPKINFSTYLFLNKKNAKFVTKNK